VDTFCFGCADLRKGALIIGSVNLVIALIQFAYNGWLLVQFTIVNFLQLPQEGSSDTEILFAVILGIFEVVCIIRVVVNVLLILAAKKPGEGVGHTLPWMIVTAIGILFGLLAILIGSFTSIPDVALGIYFFIVINSYRNELKGSITVRFPGEEPVTI